MRELILNTDSMIVLLVTVLLAFAGIILRLHGELAELRSANRDAIKGVKDDAAARMTELETRLRAAETAITALQELYKRTEAGRLDEFISRMKQNPPAPV